MNTLTKGHKNQKSINKGYKYIHMYICQDQKYIYSTLLQFHHLLKYWVRVMQDIHKVLDAHEAHDTHARHMCHA